ncbi:hypothetical protein JCM9279_004413 [Rhodotorula babjevae]
MESGHDYASARGVFLPASLSPVALYQQHAQGKQPKHPSALPTLIGVVAESIAEVAILCAVGWFLAHKGIVDGKAKKILNKINTSIFTPCLLFNKVAFSLTPDKLAELYIIPIGFCIVSAFSAGVAYLFGRLVRLNKGQRNFAIACATFQNSNSLPIALLQSLIGEKLPLQWGPHDTRDAMLGRGLSYLVLFSSLGIIVRWSIGVKLLTSAESQTETGEVPPEGDVEQQAADGSASAPYEVREDEADGAREDDALLVNGGAAKGDKRRSILKNGSSAPRTRESTTASSSGETAVNGHGTSLDPTAPSFEPHHQDQLQPPTPTKKKQARIVHSFPNTPIPSVSSRSELNSTASEYDEDEDEDDEEDDEMSAEWASEDGHADAEWGAQRGFGRRFLDSGRFSRVRRFGRTAQKKLQRFWVKFSDFMTVPLWAAVLSLVVACIPPLQHTLNQAEPLKAAIRSAGSCSVPITLVTLGAYFYRPTPAAAADSSPLRPEGRELPPSARRNSTSRSPARRPPRTFSRAMLARLRNPFAPIQHTPELVPRGSGRGETRTVVVSVVTRMIIVPLCLIPLFAWYAKATINVADDPVFVVVACLLIGAPSAITLAMMSAASGAAVFERLIARTLLISYAFLTAPTTIILVLAAIWINGLQHPEGTA